MPVARPTPDDGAAPRERVVADRVRAAFAASGVEDDALALELTSAVFRFVEKRGDGAARPADSVDALVENALRDAGHVAAARAYADDRARRERAASELTIIRSKDGGDSGVVVEPWTAAAWSRRLAKETDLPPPLSEEIVDAAERRLAALGLKSASERLVREILQAEMVERGYVGDVAEREFAVSRKAIARALISEAASPRDEIAGPVLFAAAVDDLSEPLRRARDDGLIELKGLDRAPALERVDVSTALLLGAAKAEALDPASALLRARLTLDRLRAHVGGVVAIPDLIGRIARAVAETSARPDAAADDALRALDFSNAFGRVDGAIVEAQVPLDGFDEGGRGARERAFVAAFLERAADRRPASLRLTFSTEGAASKDPFTATIFPFVASALRSDPAAAVVVRRDAAEDPFLRRPEAESARRLWATPLRAALNVPLALFDAREGTVKDALERLRAPLSLLTDAFHEALWRQRRGAPFGVHGAVVLFGGPAEVLVDADGQEVDLELWGLPLALDLLARRGVAARSKLAETAARILNFAEFLGGEERSGLALRPRLCGVLDRETGLRFHAAVDAAARAARDDQASAALKRPRGGEGVLPVVAPFFDDANRPLLSGLCSPRLGPGLSISESALPEGLSPSTFAALVEKTRLRRVSFAPPGASEGLFEVQEELFA